MNVCLLQPRAAAGVQGSRPRAGLALRVLAVSQQSSRVQQQVRSVRWSAPQVCSAGREANPGEPSPLLLLLSQGLEAQRPAEQQNGALRIGPNQQQQQAAAPAAAQPGQDAAREQRLQLHYRTRWQQPLLHHSLAGGEWRSVPMQQVSAQCCAVAKC